jgi:RNA polymerase sigma-70 factor (ECF subfamily)
VINQEHAVRVRQCFKESHAQIVHWLAAHTGSMAIAREVVDQAFAKVLEIEHPEAVIDIRPYVYRTAFNLASRRAETAAIHDRLHRIVANEWDAIAPSPEPAFMEHERLQTLQSVLEALPPRVRMALRLRFWDELSYAEITARFREKGVVVNERTIKRWVARGLECCREEIESQEGYR